MTQRAYKTKLILNNQERSMMAQCAGASRFVFNWGLAEIKRVYDETKETDGKGKFPSARNQLKKQFNALKYEEFPWILDLPYVVTESAFIDLDTAMKNFFRRLKNGEAKAGFPRFKSRYDRQSFRLRGTVRVEDNRVKLPKIGWVRLAEKDYVPEGDANFATISRTANDDQWWIAVNMDYEPEPVALRGGYVLGVDLGVKSAAVDSDGDVYGNAAPYRALEKKLARLQRELHRRQKGSANREKTKRKIARLHRQIAAVRRHEQHNITRELTFNKRPEVIVLEDLNVKGMTAKVKPKEREDGNGYEKNGSRAKSGLAKSVLDVGLHELRRQVEYKAEWAGISVHTADRFYPSSKTCSGCGAIDSDLTLSDRTYTCTACGLVIDRDLNAARNLAALAEPVMHGGLPVELDGLPSTEKQEASTLR